MSHFKQLLHIKGYSSKVISGVLRLWKNGTTTTMPFPSEKQACLWLESQEDALIVTDDPKNPVKGLSLAGMTPEQRDQAILEYMNKEKGDRTKDNIPLYAEDALSDDKGVPMITLGNESNIELIASKEGYSVESLGNGQYLHSFNIGENGYMQMDPSENIEPVVPDPAPTVDDAVEAEISKLEYDPDQDVP